MRIKCTISALVAAAALAGGAAAQPFGGGMMGGPGGWGMGPGMMGGGWGGPGADGWGPAGPGMMMGAWDGWGYPGDLSADQRSKISDAQRDFQKKQWPLMQQMHTLMWNANSPASAGAPFDEQAARKSYDTVAALHKQMFENTIELRKRVDAVLTPQQRDEMRKGWRR